MPPPSRFARPHTLIPTYPATPNPFPNPNTMQIFTVINWVTIIAAILAAIAELLSLIFVEPKTLPGFTVRLYCLAFLLLIIFSELEWSKPVRECK